ncbi:ADP-ribosylglycohydrolase family protein [Amycolatopsis endophytica]|uniref:ADP-ribosylglycohydrolase n=1 Tax=Amycolatopsis endophytica TaxID=860233 RepID=A0A853B5Z4_9PSEU|nr:ADP-ribosylglycohydrolase family protein [Amycolatopsis endophytica]NYI90235.1 ADP-ribosylglycohydrolase [Amycolatopsis endophytica]
MRERVLSTLAGLAIGDALGMPTEGKAPHDITPVTNFQAARGMPAGGVTDDTQQAVIMARLLIGNDGRIDPRRLADELLDWERDLRSRGIRGLLGPSTRAAVTAVAAGEPLEKAGRHGTTNGAAMRIAPVGIVNPPELPLLVDRVVEASWVTHNTGVALAGAAAVAAAVSAGIGGASREEATDCAIEAAELAARRGNWVAAGDVAARIRWARTMNPADIASLIGTSVATQESVPAAFAVLAHNPDPWEACRVAASLGGDTDTIASMAGAIAGACHGAGAFPEEAVRTVTEVNELPLPELADGLLKLRARN